MVIKDYTERILADTLCALLKESTFENITIGDIVNRSCTSRATFYRHFKDKYDLMNWVFKKQVDEIIRNSPNSFDYKNILLQCLYFLIDKQEYFSQIIKIQGQNSFSQFLYTYSLNYCKEQIIKKTGNDKLPYDVLFSLKLYNAGLTFMAEEWLRSGLKNTPEQITQTSYDCMPQLIKNYFC